MAWLKSTAWLAVIFPLFFISVPAHSFSGCKTLHLTGYAPGKGGIQGKCQSSLGKRYNPCKHTLEKYLRNPSKVRYVVVAVPPVRRGGKLRTGPWWGKNYYMMYRGRRIPLKAMDSYGASSIGKAKMDIPHDSMSQIFSPQGRTRICRSGSKISEVKSKRKRNKRRITRKKRKPRKSWRKRGQKRKITRNKRKYRGRSTKRRVRRGKSTRRATPRTPRWRAPWETNSAQ